MNVSARPPTVACPPQARANVTRKGLRRALRYSGVTTTVAGHAARPRPTSLQWSARDVHAMACAMTNKRRAMGWAVVLVGATAMGCTGRADSRDRQGIEARQAALTLQATFAPTDDVSISDHNGGVTETAGELMVWDLTGSDPYKEEALIRFGNLSLPAGATVTSATLTLTFDNWSTGFSVLGRYLNKSWNPAAVGWFNRDTGTPWASPGASGSGTDVLASPTFVVSGFSGSGVEVKTVALDPSVVQGWLNNPASNQGVLLTNQNTNAVTRIYSAEDTATPSRAPVLTVNYTTGGGCLSSGPGQWQNTSFATSANAFTVTFDATPSASPTDAAFGLSLGAASSFTQLATIARFNSSGTIDARNGGSYAATTSVSYAANSTYHFRMVVDVAAHVYALYVTAPGGAEQTVGTAFAFRTEQASVSSLNNWAVTVDPAAQGTLNVCNVSVSNSGTGTGGVGGGTGGAGGTGGNATGGSSGGAGGAGGNQPPTVGQHPRIWLDPATLSSLRAKAQAQDTAWTNLRDKCNSYNGGTVRPPDLNEYSAPDIGEGYQGEAYFGALMNVALCYQIGKGLSPPDANLTAWINKGNAILSVMSGFTNYARDDGFGIRFYGTGLALGFDFLYGDLTPAVKTQVIGALNGWLSYFTGSGFCHGHPHGNYFAGYYAAKAYAALAVAGDDNALSATWWTHFLKTLHYGGPGALTDANNDAHTGVQQYYARFLAGGGWSEGWGYGGLATSNMALPALAVKTATGTDLIRDPAAPFPYPLANGLHMIEFTWPSRMMLDDRDTLRAGNLGTSFPARPSSLALVVTASMLTRWNDALAPQFHAFAREVRGLVGSSAPWSDFLFWDNAGAESRYDTLPRSYLAGGLNVAAMRSDWSTTATWASFRASSYVDCGYAGEQLYDAGGLAIVKGGTPLLANATGVLMTTYPGSVGTPTYETPVLDDISGNRTLYNTFANGTGRQVQVIADRAPAPLPQVTKFEDGGGYVRMRGENLQVVYESATKITSWTRDVVFVRPSAFVVYDRTTVADTTGDQRMRWHLMFTPRQVSSPAPADGTTRYEVTNPDAGFLGAVTAVLPARAPTQLIDVYGSHKIFRLEVRPAAAATAQTWLTVFDTAASPGAAASLTSSTNVKAVIVPGTAGNSVAVFGAGAAGTTISGVITLSEPAATTKLVVTDLAPSTSYAVTASVAGSSHNVTIQPGTGFTTTANGTLYVNVATSGAVSAGL
jgi:hypothetical protein